MKFFSTLSGICIYLLSVSLAQCTGNRAAHKPMTEADFVYVRNCQYYTKKEYKESFGQNAPDSLLLRNFPGYVPWSDSCEVLRKKLDMKQEYP